MATVDDKSRPADVLVKHAADAFVQPTPRNAQLQHPFRVQQYKVDTHIPRRKVSKLPVDNRADGTGMPVIIFDNPAFFLPSKPDGGGGALPPQDVDIVTPAVLALSPDGNSLIYTQGVWSGVPAPVITADLQIVGGPSGISVTPGIIPIEAGWRGLSAIILENATNDGGSSGMQANSNTVAIPAAPDPEDALVALFASKRLGYVMDPRDKSTMLQAGSIPVTADGQALAVANTRLDSAANAINFLQSVVASQPLWVANDIVPDGNDDALIFPSGGTAVQPDFANLAGYVASVLVTPGPMRLQTIWTAGFGGTNTNNRLSIQTLANGAVQFVVNDGVARRVFATPAGEVADGVKALLTLFVDYQARVAKGFVNGVERASFTLLNVTDIVNNDVNRVRFFMSHGTGEYSNCKLHRAAFLHDKTDDAGRLTMEAWVMQP